MAGSEFGFACPQAGLGRKSSKNKTDAKTGHGLHHLSVPQPFLSVVVADRPSECARKFLKFALLVSM